MNKNYWNNILKNWFDIDDAKIMYYRNPDDCSNFQCEQVDGESEGFIWGQRKDKTKNWIKVCKLFFANSILLFVDSVRNFFIGLSAYINYVDMPIFICYIILAFLMYQLIFFFSGVGVIPLSHQ